MGVDDVQTEKYPSCSVFNEYLVYTLQHGNALGLVHLNGLRFDEFVQLFLSGAVSVRIPPAFTVDGVSQADGWTLDVNHA